MSRIEDICGYKDIGSDYCSPTVLHKTAATTYDFPEHSPKKDKKWSFGNLFRRKKKDDSQTSSEEDCGKKGFLTRRKKEKRKKVNKHKGSFDHIVLSGTGKSTSGIYNRQSPYDESEILSDPASGFRSYIGSEFSTELTSLDVNGMRMENDAGHKGVHSSRLSSSDGLLKRSRKSRSKIRAEVRRDYNKCDVSSDEDSQRSASSLRLRSDENLGRTRDSSLNRKSRAARTERYIRRLSRDEEGIFNRDTHVRLYKSDVENNLRPVVLREERKDLKRSPSKSPVLHSDSKSKLCHTANTLSYQHSVSGLPIVLPSHGNLNRNKSDIVCSNKFYKPPNTSFNDVNIYNSLRANYKDKEANYQRSVSYDANIHQSGSPDVSLEIFHAHLPLRKPNHRLRNLSLVEQPCTYREQKHPPPPPPPPRDPGKLVSLQHFDNNRPISCCFESALNQNNLNVHDSCIDVIQMKDYEIKPRPSNWHSNRRSTSEDHLPSEISQILLQPRPSSAASNTSVHRFIRRHPCSIGSSEDYHYLTERNPRSRKPILIQSIKHSDHNNFLINQQQSESQRALEFWKQKDKNEISEALEKEAAKKSVLSGPRMFTAETRVRTNIFLPSVLKPDLKMNTDQSHEQRLPSSFKPFSPNAIRDGNISSSTSVSDKPCDINDTTNLKITTTDSSYGRKSSNLEDALDELDAIYNSLHLGDEDLLERAEQRELSVNAKKFSNSKAEPYPGLGLSRGAISDSGFSYEPFESSDSPKRKRIFRKYRPPDKQYDDMAYRKLNTESFLKSNPKEAISKLTYLLASPCKGNDVDELNKGNGKEPDVTFDDMVYRSVKHANNSLKVSDPQPPFGIPIGPVLPGANSDYLRAVSENTQRFSFGTKKVPDLVKDDLAFRNLRKDCHKDPILPPLTPEDVVNNNNCSLDPEKPDFHSLKKKRAVRSLSANIHNLIQNQPFATAASCEERTRKNGFEKCNLTDIADVMEIARQILKEKEDKINATRRVFLSDTETKYRKLVTTTDDSVNERRLNFLNVMKTRELENNDTLQQKIQVNVPQLKDNYWQCKPPRGITQEKKVSFNDCTPVNITQTKHHKNHHRSSLDDLLTAFAVEANETSEQITNELKELENDAGCKNNCGNVSYNKFDSDSKITPEEIARQETADSISTENMKCENIGFTNNSELLATTKTESMPIEEVEQIDPIITIPKSLANIVITRNADQCHLVVSPIVIEIHSESDHDYVNIGSDGELETAISLIDESSDENICKSLFEKAKEELVTGFQNMTKIPDADEIKHEETCEQTALFNLEENQDKLHGKGDIESGKANEGVV